MARLEDFITEDGKKTQAFYNSLIEKYNLKEYSPYMEYSGCLSVTTGGYTIYISDITNGEMAGYSIINERGTALLEVNWENKKISARLESADQLKDYLSKIIKDKIFIESFYNLTKALAEIEN